MILRYLRVTAYTDQSEKSTIASWWFMDDELAFVPLITAYGDYGTFEIWVNTFSFFIKGKKRKLEKETRNGQGQLDTRKRPGETQKEFYQRLDKQAAEQVNKILVKRKRTSQKRKEYE